jgi:hypothetical protein
MSQRMHELATEIVKLQAELDQEIHRRRAVLGWQFKNGLVEFEQAVMVQHRRLREGVAGFMARAPFGTIITAPVIYSGIVPLLLLDFWVSAYQAVCFRAYRIPRVRRQDYIAVDRQRLSYLNWIEALNCLYCGYAVGLIAYAREVGSRTEQYWCPIKHALKISDPHRRYFEFLEYGDAEGYRSRLEKFRAHLRTTNPSK